MALIAACGAAAAAADEGDVDRVAALGVDGGEAAERCGDGAADGEGGGVF